MSKDGIEPNPQTFAATFECIERSHSQNKLALFKHHYQIMQQKVRNSELWLDKTYLLYFCLYYLIFINDDDDDLEK